MSCFYLIYLESSILYKDLREQYQRMNNSEENIYNNNYQNCEINRSNYGNRKRFVIFMILSSILNIKIGVISIFSFLIVKSIEVLEVFFLII